MTNVNPYLAHKTPSEWLQKVSLFADLSQADLQHLADGAQCLCLANRQELFCEGASAQHYFLVLNGKVAVFRYGADGEERVFSVFGAHHLVAIAAMFMSHGRYPMNARGQSEAVLFRRQKPSAACSRTGRHRAMSSAAGVNGRSRTRNIYGS